MPTRFTRPLLIALFACVHLVLQPLAISAPCAWIGGGSLDCCCAPAPVDDAAPSGCCATEAPAPDEGPAAPQPERCECAVAPALPPATTPELAAALGGLVPLGETVGIPTLDPAASATFPGSAWCAAGPPGHGPPRHLRLQVFRL